MAPVARFEDSIIPFATLSAHVSIALFLTYLLTRSLYHSYKLLPPSQNTRDRQFARRNRVGIFALLALTSFGIASYYFVSYAVLSYKVWANFHRIPLPAAAFGKHGAFAPAGHHPRRLHLVTWLSDVSFYREAFEVVAERARRQWWRQQLDAATIPLALFLTLEGRRRNIPHLWAYAVLSRLVGLSFAQSLFHLAVLLAPVPLPQDHAEAERQAGHAHGRILSRWDRIKRRADTKPEGWTANKWIYITHQLVTTVSIWLTQQSHETTSFMFMTLLSAVLPYLSLTFPYVLPQSWGKVRTVPSDATAAHTKLFRLASILSFLVHGGSTLSALLSNDPGPSYHRHSLRHPHKIEHRGPWERSSTSFGRVLGAIGDHPVVGMVGWDVLLSGLSIGLWAAARGLDPGHIARCIGIPGSGTSPGVVAKAEKTIAAGKETARVNTEKLKRLEEEVQERITEQYTHARKASGSSTRAGAVAARRGEKQAEADLASSSSRSTRSTRKRKGSLQSQPESVPTLYDSVHDQPVIVDQDDSAYVPPANAGPIPVGDDADEGEWEAGALTWGALVVGGLGVAGAGVYGAECAAR